MQRDGLMAFDGFNPQKSVEIHILEFTLSTDLMGFDFRLWHFLLISALHHPFTASNPEDMKDLSSACAFTYDMVYNGVEIGGGSLRIYKHEIQENVLEFVGISPK
ncbi:aspartate--tRNA ligase, chloroplastic/mitochondrial-like isoform X1 [Camellia sinensis]|uniref:aspartate--tRNA ligase, chloroplastic/mitochondrial-like isoform X1 n=2 Tax=Camellia sinensis TaxID=4442 RepID=UPI001035A9E7|nr:aspartate--tRNA ligase, chloroplastic/mitochondrial-like isoform X1 [Camellia sinensis]XP_028093934.1 aspartate--tRNA ligase, chloroplastic/mitochondrial-like isoform X1 [Camellia sinensis]XP_028093935.1 aspartate--tRNA ligase, chloroplastic/mitochondrial-like isoform X1 [Camellia sinensis]